jgi:DNA-binding MarR family transcriptional regulator
MATSRDAAKLNKSECAALQALALRYASEESILFFRGVANLTGLTEAQAKRAVRSLARKGLAEYERAFDLDGRICGSGYQCTQTGKLTYDATLAATKES